MSRTGREKGRRHSRRLAQRRLERHDGLTRQEIVARKKVALGPGRKEREGIRLRHESVVGKRVCQPRGARSERAFSVRPKTDLLRDFREHRRQADALRAKPARTVDFGFRLVAGKIHDIVRFGFRHFHPFKDTCTEKSFGPRTSFHRNSAR